MHVVGLSNGVSSAGLNRLHVRDTAENRKSLSQKRGCDFGSDEQRDGGGFSNPR
jgi:hypothetical protein